MRTIALTIALLCSVPLAVLYVASPHTMTINRPIVQHVDPPNCMCPPPPTKEELEAEEKAIQCQQFKRAFINQFGNLPYDPCPEPPKGPPLDGMGRPIP